MAAGNHDLTVEVAHLSKRIWITPQKVQVTIDVVPQNARLAPAAAEIYAKTGSIKAVVSALGVTWPTAKKLLAFAKTNDQPMWEQPGRIARKKHEQPQKFKYQQIASDVRRLVDDEKRSWPAAAKWLWEHCGIKVSMNTIRGAWEYAHREDSNGGDPREVKVHRRGRHRNLPPEVFSKIRELHGTGATPEEIAEYAGCSSGTVRLELKRIPQASRSDSGKAE